MPPGADAATATGSSGFRVVATAVIVVVMVALAGCSSSSSRPRSSSTPRSSTTVPVDAHITIYGDSLSVQAAAMLRSQGRAHGLTVTVEAYFGLAPCDLTRAVYRDVEDLGAALDALVLEFSGNNLTPCMKRDGKSLTGTAYFAKYRRDLGALVAAGVDRSIPVLVVGAPSFPDAENSPDRVELNSVLRDVAAEYPGARYVASAPEVSPFGFARVLPCLREETAALGSAAIVGAARLLLPAVPFNGRMSPGWVSLGVVRPPRSGLPYVGAASGRAAADLANRRPWK